MEEKGTETLEYKMSILNGLVSVIELNARPLTPKEKEKIDALEVGLTTRERMLVEECKHREIDMKIESMKEVIAILKYQKTKLVPSI